MKMTIDIFIGRDGKVTADVVGGHGPVCITEILAGLEELLGEASSTDLKPEYEWDPEVIQMLQRQEVQA